MSTALMVLPDCPNHGHSMELRTHKQSLESEYCGVWYDCTEAGCTCSVLFPSPALLSQLSQERWSDEKNH